MGKDISFFRAFMDGFRGQVNFDTGKSIDSRKNLENSLRLLENIYKQMSKKDETEEEFFHKK